jgi:hypothetical protein
MTAHTRMYGDNQLPSDGTTAAAASGQSLAGDQRAPTPREIELMAEVELWKDRCEAERQAHEATIAQTDDLLRDMGYAP